MNESDEIEHDVARYDSLCREKAEAEVAAADGLVPGAVRVRPVGDVLADVVLVKGEPAEADRAAGTVLAGADGEAATKALDALGLSARRFAVCSRPGRSSAAVRTQRLALIIEAVDPEVVIALDSVAAADVAAALGSPTLASGRPLRLRGRTVLRLDGLEASLGDEKMKRRVWRQLQTLAPSASEAHSGRP